VGTLVVSPIDSLEAEISGENIKIAILTVPGSEAQKIADRLVKAGISAILNYTPANLMLPDNVHVQNIDPVLHLQRMLYYLAEG